MSVGSTYCRPIVLASTMMLISIVIEIVPSSSSVVAAFLLFGLRNAGTPFEIASTPVRAALPEENARASRKTRARPVRCPLAGNPRAGMIVYVRALDVRAATRWRRGSRRRAPSRSPRP